MGALLGWWGGWVGRQSDRVMGGCVIRVVGGDNLTDRVTGECITRVVGGGNLTDRVPGECIIRVAREAI